jgi:hypothetical protein
MSLLSLFLILCGAAVPHALVGRAIRSRLPAGPTPPGGPAAPPVSRAEVAGLLAVLAVALVLGLNGIDNGLEYDELTTATYFVEVDSFADTVTRYVAFNNHIAYSVLARLARLSLGHADWVLRVPALALALAGVFCLWLFARRLIGPGGGLVAALCLAVAPCFTAYSHRARGYTGLTVCTLVSGHLYLRLLHRPRRAELVGFVMVSTLGIYFHLYGALVTVVQGLFLLLLSSWQLYRGAGGPVNRRSFQGLWVALAAVAGLSLALYSPVLHQIYRVTRGFGPGTFQPRFPLDVLELFAGSPQIPVLAGASSLAALGGVALFRRDRVVACYVLCLLVAPLLAVWLSKPAALFPRFFIYWLPYFVLCCAAGLRAVWAAPASGGRAAARIGVRLGAVLLLAAGALTWARISWTQIYESGLREGCRILEADTSEATVCCAIGGDPQILQWYCRHKLLFPRSVPEMEALLRSNPDVRCIYMNTAWEPPAQTQIANRLAERAAVRRAGNVSVYICQEGQPSQ